MEKVYKLHRLWNIFNPPVHKDLFILIPLIIAFALLHVVEKAYSPYVYISAGIAALILAEWRILRHCPKSLTFCGQDFLFTNNVYLPPRIPFGHIHGIGWLKVQYRISDIQNLTFQQNELEKLFDVGHIVFSGKVSFEAKRDMDRIKVPDEFRIYGIKHFTEFKECVKKQKPPSK